jgi:hypothetical protein
MFVIRVFVPDRPFQPSGVLDIKARSLAESRAPERCCTRVGSSLAYPEHIRLGWKGLRDTNALAYHEKSQLTAVKKFNNIGPRTRKCKTRLEVTDGVE